NPPDSAPAFANGAEQPFVGGSKGARAPLRLNWGGFRRNRQNPDNLFCGLQSMKSEDTDDSVEIRSIVSASSSAIETWRILPQALASSRSGIVSVTTSSSSTDSLMRSTALPDSTGWVQ